jgi:signal transduction histidine kinase
VQVWVDRLVLRQATIYVIDTGPGIAPPHRAHIFDRFCLVDTARSRGRGGTGPGLSIARWAVEAHGGRIELESEEGRGSTFRLVLLVANSQPSRDRE